MADFVPGTITVFNQTSAPTSWTKITTYDNYALRVVSGTATVSGSMNFTSCLTSRTWGGTVSTDAVATGVTTLTTPQIPIHNHGVVNAVRNPAYAADNPLSGFGQFSPGGAGPFPAAPSTSQLTGVVSGSLGGGGSHDHPVSLNISFTGSSSDFSVNYIDVILASKN